VIGIVINVVSRSTKKAPRLAFPGLGASFVECRLRSDSDPATRQGKVKPKWGRKAAGHNHKRRYSAITFRARATNID
jgi:hypothetical protein